MMLGYKQAIFKTNIMSFLSNSRSYSGLSTTYEIDSRSQLKVSDKTKTIVKKIIENCINLKTQ